MCYIQARSGRLVCTGFELTACLQQVAIVVVGYFPKANSMVIRPITSNGNTVAISERKSFPMVILEVIQWLSGDWCVVTYLLLVGLH